MNRGPVFGSLNNARAGQHEGSIFHRSINTIDMSISPIQLLPPKILTQIFINYNLPSKPVVYLPPRRDLQYPWTLGHVCSQWRETLWNSPNIWGTIYMVPCRHETVVWDILNVILSHTNGLISLSISRYSYSLLRVGNLIRSFSHRFRGLILSTKYHYPLYLLLDSTASVAHLEDLYLLEVESNHMLPTFIHPSSDIPRRFPSLRKLGVSGNTSIARYLPHFPLSQLTHLSVAGYMASPTIVHVIIQQCTALLSAELAICRKVAGTSTSPTTGTITSPLKHIDLIVYFDLDWDSFLNPLCLPCLSTFSNSDCSRSRTGLSHSFPHAIASLIDRSNCSLNSFSISYYFETLADPYPPHPDISNLVQKMPGLTAFMSGYIAAPAFIRVIHESLTKLEVVDWKVEPDGLRTFLDLFDNYVAQKSSPGQFPRLTNIICRDGDGFSHLCRRHIRNYAIYEEVGVDMMVRNIEYDDVRFVYEGYFGTSGLHRDFPRAMGLNEDVTEDVSKLTQCLSAFRRRFDKLPQLQNWTSKMLCM